MADTRHETSDVDLSGLLRFGVGLLAAGVAIPVLVWLLFIFLASRQRTSGPPEYPLAAQQEARVPPEPRLQTNPRQDLLNFRAQEEAVLTSYGWVDKSAGIVRIPLDEAMRLTVQRGLPARDGTSDRR